MHHEKIGEEFDALELSLQKKEIMEHVRDEAWQRFRASLHGLPTSSKVVALVGWLHTNSHSHASRVQVMNYKNALRRAGFVSPR